jgi:hypothetical protein
MPIHGAPPSTNDAQSGDRRRTSQALAIWEARAKAVLIGRTALVGRAAGSETTCTRTRRRPVDEAGQSSFGQRMLRLGRGTLTTGRDRPSRPMAAVQFLRARPSLSFVAGAEGGPSDC